MLYQMWLLIKRRMPHAICWRIVCYNGRDVMAVWTLAPPNQYVAQPVSLFDTQTKEWIADAFH